MTTQRHGMPFAGLVLALQISVAIEALGDGRALNADWHVIGNGGSTVSSVSAHFEVEGTVGQSCVHRGDTVGGYDVQSGFWGAFLGTAVELSLSAEWSLFSVPLEPYQRDIDALLGRVPHGPLWCWDGDSYRKVDELTAGLGYWVYCLAPATLVVHGRPTRKPCVELTPTWNLVGPLRQGRPTRVALNIEPEGAVRDPVWCWDRGIQGYVPTDSLLPCEGGWLWAARQCTWR